MTRRPKSKGLMPRSAASALLRAIDRHIHVVTQQAVKTGVLTAQEAEDKARRMHMERVDKWLSILDNLKEPNGK